MRARRAFLTIAFLVLAAPAWSHPAPFSYLDLQLGDSAVRGSLVAHTIDLAHELGLSSPEALLDPAVARANRDRMFALLRSRIGLVVDGAQVPPEFEGLEVLRDRQAIRFQLRFALAPPPAAFEIHAALFPYDPNHQTFVNVYEDDALAHQAIFDSRRTSLEYFRGTPQGAFAVVRKFIAEGIHHIVIGPDHVLFLIGLLLLGGRLMMLVRIVTAFTVAHSITLSLAVLNLVNPSSRIVEPAIALSIIYVGADNLLVGVARFRTDVGSAFRRTTGRLKPAPTSCGTGSKEARDVRAWIAFTFGLIHGFGFASVLKEMDLPRQALGWSLASFNVGVEIGQLGIVAIVASALAAVRHRSEAMGRRLALAGSVGVIAAGAYWFVERMFFTGGV
jgi:hypothetical protein